MMYTFLRVLLYGVRGFRRNIWLAVIAIVTMTMTLLTFTVFATANIVAKQRYEAYNQKIDYLIFLKDEAPEVDIDQLRTQITARSEVRSSNFFTKEQVKQQFDEDLATVYPDLKGIITDENNPLLRYITVKFHQADQIKNFDGFVTQDRYKALIHDTSYRENQQNIDNYLRVTNFLKAIGIGFTILYTLIALMVILNTIRLTIHSRREEIEIMRLVGASPSYTRGPFVVEGVLYGTIGAILAALVSWFILSQLQTLVQQSFAVGGNNILTEIFGDNLGLKQTDSVGSLLTYLFVLQIGMGVLLGVFCSLIAVRRYLKEQ